MSIQDIEEYEKEVINTKIHGGVDHELAIRRHFANLLSKYCAKNKDELFLVDEKTIKNAQGQNIRPDGTICNNLIDFGYWESKANVHLENEIIDKIEAGYPLSNTLFQDDKDAILYQEGIRCFQCSLNERENLDKLLTKFITFKSKEVREFYEAMDKFKDSLPVILEMVNQKISLTEQINSSFTEARQKFLSICEKSINPNISIGDVNEMLLQHILTEEIFMSIFDDANIHKKNNIAEKLYELESTLFGDNTKKRETLSGIQSYYDTIKKYAIKIVNYHDKQAFLKAFYENFYNVYNNKAADRMGIIYTPHEIVKFQIRSVEDLLKKHFNATLADENIKILDPCVGTGTYICDLIDYLPHDKLEFKYKNDIFCNELGLLPYYIANLNIEYTYQQKMQAYFKHNKISDPDYKFNNLCWVDTLDNAGFGIEGVNIEIEGIGFNVENTTRIKKQNEQQISVIIGNPPYNANQQNENDNNKNRVYKIVDEQIKKTYIKASKAQKTKVYDMYSRFYRWASDRISNDKINKGQGIISFVTNNSFINAKSFDGFRECIKQEFDFAYIIDTKSDVRANPKIAGTTHNVFGIQTGVAFMFLVKKKNLSLQKKPCQIYYLSLPDEMPKREKLNWLSENRINFAFDLIAPDNQNNWINQSDNDFDALIPICDKENKSVIFQLFSSGVVTNKDEWLYDLDKHNLTKKINYYLEIYNKETIKYKGMKWEILKDIVDNSIKWTRGIYQNASRGKLIEFNSDKITACYYRPFYKLYTYFSKELNETRYQMPKIYGEMGQYENKMICYANNEQTPFLLMSINNLCDLNFCARGSFCLPLHIYDKQGNQQENITDWALELFQKHYNNPEITKERIFNYVYAVLHDPNYREKYEQNLKREFPRIPLYEKFEQWASLGKELMDLHLNYESVEKYPLKRIDIDKANLPKVKLKADKINGVIILDENTQLSGVPNEAWDYKLGNRSALEWVLDQYKEKTPKDATIAEKFNNYCFADYKEQVIDLLGRVCRVSVETVRIVETFDNLSSMSKMSNSN